MTDNIHRTTGPAAGTPAGGAGENGDDDVVIVTGSSGLIGSAVVRRLADRYRVAGFDRPGFPHPPEEADPVDVDLSSDESVRRGLQTVRDDMGPRIASVVHLAAYYNFSGEESPLYEEVTVRGTGRLLDGLHALGFEVGQFVFSSTMLVHVPCEPGQKITEDWPLAGKWPYPQSKIRTEALIRRKRGNIPAVFLRIAGVYDEMGHSIPLANQMQRIREKWLTSRVFPGDLSHGQAFVHRDDVVEAIRLTVERRKQLPPEVAILIGEPETLGYGQLQRRFGELIHGEAWDTRPIPKAMAKAGAWVQDVAAELPMVEEPFIKPWMIDLADDHYELDVTRARTLLGWEPRHSLRESLPKMVEAMKSDPAGWYRENGLELPSGEQKGEPQEVGRTA